jgi:superfamily I DNA/RNA helicase
VDPRDADLVVSTVHKVKGLEWPTVSLDAHLVPEQSDGQSADGSKDELMRRVRRLHARSGGARRDGRGGLPPAPLAR